MAMLGVKNWWGGMMQFARGPGPSMTYLWQEYHSDGDNGTDPNPKKLANSAMVCDREGSTRQQQDSTGRREGKKGLREVVEERKWEKRGGQRSFYCARRLSEFV